MRNVLMGLGMLMLAVGVSIADSDSLIIPVVLAISGSLIMMFAGKEDCDE